MIRSFLIKVEPFLFALIAPLLSGGKARYARSLLMQKYCKGHGAEIGAGVQPVLVPRGSKTTYIDAVPADFWRKRPQWADQEVLQAEIIDEGSTLATVKDETFDYLVAAHVLEHIEDPILALKNWVRVVKPGGHIVIAVPDMRLCGEEHRELSTVDHLQKDHDEGPQVSAEYHYREHGLNLGEHSGEKRAEYIKEHERMIHYHTFTLTSLVRLLSAVEGIGFEIVEACLNVNEDIAVLRKTASTVL